MNQYVNANSTNQRLIIIKYVNKNTKNKSKHNFVNISKSPMIKSINVKYLQKMPKEIKKLYNSRQID